MKTIINKFKFCTLILLVAFSCTEIGDDPAFDTSASERSSEAVTEIKATLTEPTEGWIFEYYPHDLQIYGGYNYILSFDDNNMVDVYSERQADFSIPETSSYDILSIGGPVLTFDTYNSVMHEFSTPSAAEYQAKGGDHEFILSHTDVEDVLNARGTVSDNNLKLIKLTESPQSYLTKVKEIVDYLDGAVYIMSTDGEITQIPVSNRNITFPGEDLEEDTVVAFIYTDTGIKLYETTTINGNEVTEFTLDKDANQLISLDGSTVLDIVFPPLNTSQNWIINVIGAGEVSDTFFNTFVNIYNNNGAIYGETLSTDIEFGNTITPTGIQFYSSGYYAEYNVTFPLLFSNPELLSIARKGAGFNWQWYGHLDPLITLIVDNEPYEVEGTPADDPTVVKLTSTVDPDVWFTIRK
ncbi:DUF4302 domain-containing protein [Algibacter lectus]|uniref:Uncharacterized protein DUF4302 n=1 Tax=Algibacter lectus TaxID=221126 RepID=A0A4R8M4D1_9FLAO|nr:DUF4302 domain-containing protein [Algibacter lectus]MWW26328.1 DUF4302 domain-containing protein [Algibacter lectus]TDY60089.1 uncharacterized protein DUF4302 [Algibacter lectus]